jgi:hypothetical protein
MVIVSPHRPLVKVVAAVAAVVPGSPRIAGTTAVSRDELIDFVSARHHAIASARVPAGAESYTIR